MVIEYFGDPVIVTNEEGSPLLFDDFTDARDVARECQKGIVVPLATDLIDIIKDAYNQVGMFKYDFGEDIDVGESGECNGDDCLEAKLGYLLGRGEHG